MNILKKSDTCDNAVSENNALAAKYQVPTLSDLGKEKVDQAREEYHFEGQ